MSVLLCQVVLRCESAVREQCVSCKLTDAPRENAVAVVVVVGVVVIAIVSVINVM